ncbi:hypothetical protein BCLUESOX_1059 [bacterium endosymbiont of Bathymodiolus sp. 5 South]|nr:hypothetical protein [uncultured Gammaproteobacteria bacterium]SHN93811.1 hypothetical protein BCLUESOX_1059 [bacterium endosymbiont of Bathymodiolus sp. 5 South]VVH55238.1 hypothetical protein BSPCLSOX_1129 [uncultured Gammaproteobacteria bacterium]
MDSFWHCFVGEKNDYYTLFIVLLFFEFFIRWLEKWGAGLFGVVFKGRLFKYISIHSCKFHQSCFSITPKDSIPLI